MFYDDLSQYGQWVDYENYGPVWRPSSVNEDWRPYTDGRWVPTNDGYVFESQEPWAGPPITTATGCPPPATAGFGPRAAPGTPLPWNGAPVLKPRQWTPLMSVGPPFRPPIMFRRRPTLRQAAIIRGSGDEFTHRAVLDLRPGGQLPAGVWTTLQPRLFLWRLRLSGPAGLCAGVLPTDGIRAKLLYAELLPADLFRRGFAGAYSYGPPVRYISRVTNINQTVINQTINNNTVNITRINNVVAPANVVSTNAGIRHIQPPALTQGQALPRAQRLTNVNTARASLGRPNVVAAPQNLPRLTAQIPKAPPLAAQPVKGGVPGRPCRPRPPCN